MFTWCHALYLLLCSIFSYKSVYRCGCCPCGLYHEEQKESRAIDLSCRLLRPCASHHPIAQVVYALESRPGADRDGNVAYNCPLVVERQRLRPLQQAGPFALPRKCLCSKQYEERKGCAVKV